MMKRRNFLKKVPLMAGASMTVNNIPLRAMTEQSRFLKLAEESTNDRVLVILQLHGGNDGLNMVIPVEQYDLYYANRPNIAIPARNSVRKFIELDSTLPSANQVGLHPDMIGAKDLYDRGRMAIVQGVSYPNNNGSHFRGRDITHMGGGPEDYFDSGWVGRYLQGEFPNYPDAYPNEDVPDPLAIELGSDVSLIFHQSGNIPASISLAGDPKSFSNLIDGLEGFEDELIDPRGKPPVGLENSPYGKELNWILSLEDKTEDYAARLLKVFEAADQTKVTYPETYPFNAPGGSIRNRLTPQLQLIAKLLQGGAATKGGVGTKVFLIRMGGFDTHADQVESYDPTMGGHAAKMYHISAAMQAFQADLRERGIEDRVLTLTTSEFGRRVKSNGSFGTDHGKAAPMLLFGKYINPGVTGESFKVKNNNLEMQFDYRQIYSSILRDWLKVPEERLFQDYMAGGKTNKAILPNGENQFMGDSLPLIAETITGTEGFFKDRFRLNDAFPNPAIGHTHISFYINTSNMVTIKLLDVKGNLVKTILNKRKDAGEHELRVDLTDLKPGMYIYQIESGILKDSKKLVIKN